jgi:FdhE protein
MAAPDPASQLALIPRAAAALKTVRPGYGPLIDFYSALFVAQAACAETLLLPGGPPVDGGWKARMAAGFPLVGLRAMPWDRDAAGRLLEEIGRIALRDNPGLASDARALLRGIADGRLEAAALCAALLREEDGVFADSARELAVDKRFLAFVAHHALRPALETAAAGLAPLLSEHKGWERGICPICGGLPGLSVLEAEGGERRLVCGMCSHRWSVQRLTCPFCGERNAERLRYTFSAEEPEYRTELCDGCRRYWKTVDLRRLQRPCFLPLEQVASLHLDLQAQQAGYRSEGTPEAPPANRTAS